MTYTSPSNNTNSVLYCPSFEQLHIFNHGRVFWDMVCLLGASQGADPITFIPCSCLIRPDTIKLSVSPGMGIRIEWGDVKVGRG